MSLRAASQGGRPIVAGLRVLILGLVALALWNPPWFAERAGSTPREVVVDASVSFAARRPAARALASRLDGSLLVPTDLAGEDPAGALRRAVDRAAGSGGDVLLLSDARFEAADVEAAIAHAERLGVPIHTLCPREPEAPLLALAGVEAPREVRAGAPLALRLAVAWNGRGAEGLAVDGLPVQLVVRTGGAGAAALGAVEVEMTRGDRSVVVELEDEAVARATEGDRVELAVTVASPALRGRDPFPEDDSARVVIPLAGQPPRAALVLGRDADLAIAAAIAERAGAPVRWDVTSVDAVRAGSGVAAVIALVDVAASELSEAALDRLEAHVRGGGGLVVAGARHAFGPGGYAGRRHDAWLPVRSDPEDRSSRPLDLVVCVDRSGSMGREAAPGRSKLVLALEAAARAAADLRGADRVALLGFAERVDTLLPLGPARLTSEAARAWSGAGGETEAFGALHRALDLLGGSADASEGAATDVAAGRLRHVVLISDGRSDATADRAASLARLAERLGGDGRGEARPRISVVAITPGADTGLLEAIAAAGGGESVSASATAAELARALRRASDPRKRDLLARGPHAARPGPAFGALDLSAAGAPWRIGDAARTAAKDDAEVGVVADAVGPVLAWSRLGAGTVAAVPIDASPAAIRWIAAAVRRALPASVAGRRARIERRGDAAVIVVDLGADAAAGSRLEARFADGEVAPLHESAPGLFRSPPLSLQAAPRVARIVDAGAGGGARAVAEAWLPPRLREVTTTPPDRALLEAMAVHTGGRVISERGPLPPRRPRSTPTDHVRRWAALLAALLVVVLFGVESRSS